VIVRPFRDAGVRYWGGTEMSDFRSFGPYVFRHGECQHNFKG
jgi:hypothetical protein